MIIEAFALIGGLAVGATASFFISNNKNKEKLDSLNKEIENNKNFISQISSVDSSAKEKEELLTSKNSALENQVEELQKELLLRTKDAEELNQVLSKAKFLEQKNTQLLESARTHEINERKHSVEFKELEDENSVLKNQIQELNVKFTQLKENINKPQPKEIKPVIKKSILMVDDSAVIRASMKKLLLENNFDVTLAKDGVEALEIFPTKKFDVIITDLEMPNLNGFGLMTKLNSDPVGKNIPLLIVTGHEDIHIQTQTSENLYGVFKKPWNDNDVILKLKFLSSLINE